jgi:hypothetical protein
MSGTKDFLWLAILFIGFPAIGAWSWYYTAQHGGLVWPIAFATLFFSGLSTVSGLYYFGLGDVVETLGKWMGYVGAGVFCLVLLGLVLHSVYVFFTLPPLTMLLLLILMKK